MDPTLTLPDGHRPPRLAKILAVMGGIVLAVGAGMVASQIVRQVWTPVTGLPALETALMASATATAYLLPGAVLLAAARLAWLVALQQQLLAIRQERADQPETLPAPPALLPRETTPGTGLRPPNFRQTLRLLGWAGAVLAIGQQGAWAPFALDQLQAGAWHSLLSPLAGQAAAMVPDLALAILVLVAARAVGALTEQVATLRRHALAQRESQAAQPASTGG